MSDMQITVDFGSLETLAGDIGNQASTLESTLEALKARLAPVIAQWDGGASAAYQDVQKRWDESAADLQQVLASIGAAVRAAGDAFQQGEQQNQNRWA
jgi:early secretory antigenic target protein ESAT-6